MPQRSGRRSSGLGCPLDKRARVPEDRFIDHPPLEREDTALPYRCGKNAGGPHDAVCIGCVRAADNIHLTRVNTRRGRESGRRGIRRFTRESFYVGDIEVYRIDRRLSAGTRSQ